MLRLLHFSGLLVILLTELSLSNQFILFDKKFDDSQSKDEQLLRSNQNIDEEGNIYEQPSCRRNCTELNPEDVLRNCPALQRGLTCGKYKVYHYHRRCLTATVYCRRNMTNIKEVAAYVAVIGTDLDANKTGLFVIPYIDRKEMTVPQIIVEKAHHGNGNMGELVCGSSGSWILYDTKYRYMVKQLFCLVVEARNLNYLLDLRHPKFNRTQSLVPYQQGDPNFFNQP
uniref:Kazal-like domain-containing protein n=1 Tax=Elaeophora elaphi TaxID=1147741 RepID=A0A0R3RUP7_9BILA